jgi:hypothetical protein
MYPRLVCRVLRGKSVRDGAVGRDLWDGGARLSRLWRHRLQRRAMRPTHLQRRDVSERVLRGRDVPLGSSASRVRRGRNGLRIVRRGGLQRRRRLPRHLQRPDVPPWLLSGRRVPARRRGDGLRYRRQRVPGVLDDLRRSAVHPAVRRDELRDGLLPGWPLQARKPERRMRHGGRVMRRVWRRHDLHLGSLRHHLDLQREHVRPGVL